MNVSAKQTEKKQFIGQNERYMYTRVHSGQFRNWIWHLWWFGI